MVLNKLLSIQLHFNWFYRTLCLEYILCIQCKCVEDTFNLNLLTTYLHKTKPKLHSVLCQ